MSELYLARQPIYDSELGVFAYELLYRASEENSAPAGAGDQATYSVLVNALTEIGLDELVGPHYAFINLTRGFLVGDNPMPFSGSNVVLEVLEDIPADEAVLAGVRRLAEEGHMIALDDFVYDESLRPLVELCDIVKLDIMALDEAQLREHVETLSQYDLKLLAEKVETQEEFELCKALGFDYYQGYFFCKPNLLKRTRVTGSQLALAQLLAKLSDPDVGMDELDAIVSHDVALSYKLLRYVNSAFFALPAKVACLRQALTYLGIDLVKQWSLVLAMSSIEDKPHELLTTALVRARLCELIADECGYEGKERYFMVGLFSVLDALLDLPLEEVIASLPLAEEVTTALLQQEGQAGETLQQVIAFERGQWDQVDGSAFSPEQLQGFYLEAIRWVRAVGMPLK
ncbi:MAG TPA: HDOD domain-containing protein [Candidatus Tenderia sp.]|nr:HDOD domain-containing protein [Candidatus Tenderia sp.]